MSSSNSPIRFVDDKRGVSAVIGFILIFGILVLLLTTYQAAIVPQQNAQTEFEHFEENRDEMVQLRNSISTAGQSNISQFPSVKLGTNYQTRLFAINPPPATGTLQTSEESYNITISDGNNEPVEIPTRFLEYQPGYNEITIGSTWYENSVLYLDERGTSGTAIIEEQNIITDGEKLKLTALQNKFSKSGTRRATVELYPTRSNEKDIEDLEGELTVELPTRLTDSDHWDILNDTLNEDTAVRSNGVDESNEIDEGVFLLELEVDSVDDIEMNTVGIQDEPNEGSVNNVPDRGSGGNGEEGTEINPAGPADVRLVSVTQNDNGATMTFVNDGEDSGFISGRVGFLFGGPGGGGPGPGGPGGGGDPTQVTNVLGPDGQSIGGPWDIGGNFSDFDDEVELEKDEETEITYEFNNNYRGNQAFFVTTLTLRDGQRATYFVSGEY